MYLPNPMKVKILAILYLSCFCLSVLSQEVYMVSGRILSEDNQPIPYANVVINSTGIGTVADDSGKFEIRLPGKGEWKLQISSVGYETRIENVQAERQGKTQVVVILRENLQEIDEVRINQAINQTSNLTRIDMKTVQMIPNTSGNFESILKTLPGVSSNNELSSQYSVRGGNFDENLVYINGIEVYRPFLIRSGQQEGLSFINPDLIQSVQFSAGGFDASYGDKMSSILDVTYKKPTRAGGSVSGSLLGGSAHLEGISSDSRLSWVAGVRYKTTQYLLGTLDTKGEYKPAFMDFQSFLTWSSGSGSEIGVLTNVNVNSYRFIPETRETDFGTIFSSYRLKIYYDGSELDRYTTLLGALTYKQRLGERLSINFITSAYTSGESETFDIEGQYLINELDNRPGLETTGDSIKNIGVGTFLDHARNRLKISVFSFQHSGKYSIPGYTLRWGLRAQSETIHDRLSEWKLVDSAGYSLPYSEEEVNLYDVIKSENNLSTWRASGYVENTFATGFLGGDVFVTAGIRGIYYHFSNQLLADPRVSLAWNPKWEKDFRWRLSAGIYDQPPFYKEMRNPAGIINGNIRAQRSFHLLAGTDYYFIAWERPFKFTTELYYKYLWDLIPYKLENVRVRYSAQNIAAGYATGIDLKLNGEFVRDAESWVSLSLMRTMENISNDFYINNEGKKIEPGYYPRPTDQLVNFGLYFQDYVPQNPSFRVSLYFLYGSPLPFSPPVADRYDLVYRMPAYKRVDIGFIKAIKEEGKSSKMNNFINAFRSVYLSAEIFNLFGSNNTISYLWVRTVSNLQNVPGMFAVPNYLTGRRFNIRLQINF